MMTEELLTTRIALTLSALSLPKADLLSKSDPYCVLFVKEGNNHNNQYQQVGRTETIRNNSNPTFIKQFELEYRFESEQIFLLRVYDDDFGQKQDDFLGECTFKLGTVMGSRGQVMKLPLLNSKFHSAVHSRVVLRAETLDAENYDVLHLTLHGRNMDKKDGFFFKADPYFELQVQKQDGAYVVVHRSEYVKQNLNPKWKPCAIPMHRLKNASAIRLSVTDWDEHSKHDLIGNADIRLRDLLHLTKGIELIHPPTKSKYSKSSYKNSGLVDVVECWVEKRYTFAQFLRGGLQLQLMLAVDFTASNGDPNKPGTLHHGAGRIPNSYTEALTAVGNILLEYDSDKMVQAFGFGAKPSQWEQQVSHCFPLAGTGQSEYVHGIDGALQAYTNCFERGIVFFGPTNFAPVIQRCTTIAMNTPNTYSVLLILTDGAITDMQDTINSIVFAAANAPMSIVIVGIGAADFSSMEQLDGDYQPVISSRGERCSRDIVQFVPFNKFRGNRAQLASETLKEIPDQVTEYYKLRRIPPNAPVEVALETMQSVRVPDNAGVPLAAVVVPPPPTSSFRPAPPPPSSGVARSNSSIGRQMFQGAMQF